MLNTLSIKLLYVFRLFSVTKYIIQLRFNAYYLLVIVYHTSLSEHLLKNSFFGLQLMKRNALRNKVLEQKLLITR